MPSGDRGVLIVDGDYKQMLSVMPSIEDKVRENIPRHAVVSIEGGVVAGLIVRNESRARLASEFRPAQTMQKWALVTLSLGALVTLRHRTKTQP